MAKADWQVCQTRLRLALQNSLDLSGATQIGGLCEATLELASRMFQSGVKHFSTKLCSSVQLCKWFEVTLTCRLADQMF